MLYQFSFSHTTAGETAINHGEMFQSPQVVRGQARCPVRCSPGDGAGYYSMERSDRRTPSRSAPLQPQPQIDVSAMAPNPVELCRTLLAYTAPGTVVAVPHAALAALVELASGRSGRQSAESSEAGLPQLYDVAALARRYGRAPATVRQWFADGLFGPAEERRFRRRGYVASAEAVQRFEERTGLRSAGASPALEAAPQSIAPASHLQPAGRSSGSRPAVGEKILAAAQRLQHPRRTRAS
jgi:hypothetical protein